MRQSTSLNSDMTKHFSSGFSLSSKYRGLIEQKPSKVLRNLLSSFIVYMDSFMPSYNSLHSIVGILRIVQLLGMAYCSGFENIWVPGSKAHTTISFLSVFFNYIPPRYRCISSVPFQIVVIVLFGMFFAMLFGCAIYYKKHSKVNENLCIIISLFISTFGYLLPAATLEIAGEVFSRIIMGIPLNYDKTFSLICSSIVIVLLVFYYFFYRTVYAFSFIFRPTSLLSLDGNTQMVVFASACVQGLLTGINSYLSTTAKTCICFFCSLASLYAFYRMLISQLVVSYFYQKMFIMFTFDAFMIHATMGFFTIFNYTMSPVILLVCVLLVFILFYIAHEFVNHTISSSLMILDNATDDVSFFDTVESRDKLVIIGIVGISFAHPAALNWSIFKYITEKYPNEPLYWAIFGKFVAIYPEESSLHSYIVHSIIQKSLHGVLAKQTVHQSLIIMQQREPNLTIQLKSKLEKIQKMVLSTKRKLRRIWDQVIQGNISEMESSIDSAYESIQASQAEFNRLLIQYPNNRFVARAYSRFQYEVKADFEGSQDWAEKIKVLQRGFMVNVDRTQELGYQAFPNLPLNITKSQIQLISQESNSATTDGELDDESMNMQMEESVTVREHINSLSIPSASIIIWLSFLFMFLIVAVGVAFLSILSGQISNVSKPVMLTEALAYLHVANYLIPTLSHFYILEEIDAITKPELKNYPSPLGEFDSTKEQLRYITQKTSDALQIVISFRGYKTGDTLFDDLRLQIFKNFANFTNFNSNNPKEKMSSIDDIFTDYIRQSLILVGTTPTESTLSSAVLKNSFINCDVVGQALEYTIYDTIDYSHNIVIELNMSMKLGQYIFVVVSVLLVIIGFIWEWYKVNENKRAAYKCLMVLPKGVVSSITEHLRIIKKDEPGSSKTTESDSETNKQEENLIKVFTAASENSQSTKDVLSIIMCNFFVLCSYIATGYVLFYYTSEVSDVYQSSSLPIHNIMASAAHMIASVSVLNNIYATSLSYIVSPEMNEVGQILRNSEHISKMQSYYTQMRFGNDDSYPYSSLTDFINDLPSVENCSHFTVPQTLVESINCFTPDISFRFLASLLRKSPYEISSTSAGENINDIWSLSIYSMFGNFFGEIYNSMDPIIFAKEEEIYFNTLIIVVISIFVAILASVILIYQSRIFKEKIIFTLELLLNCPGQNILQNQKIMEVLSGNFSDYTGESATRNADFYDSIIQELPESVIICNSNFEILSANKSTEKIYQLGSLPGNIKSLFQSDKFCADMSCLYSALHSNPISIETQYITLNGDKLRLSITASMFGSNLVYSTRNVTQIFYYNRLITEEKAKSDRLLMSILPPSLVSRVQAGEKNISFSVQNASIVFIDIVEFTPWCASSTASIVTSTLSTIFKEFDSLINSFSVMSKIKCIGDCYMAAGGIFSEVNQPTTNAKEAVEFGLRAISALENINSSLGFNLKIRVGVNAGGPIIAGVLGFDKPTFEIFGPAINFAQQMEHYGVPMHVHISRTVYELIYGGSFSIQERGQIDIKHGKAITYLCS